MNNLKTGRKLIDIFGPIYLLKCVSLLKLYMCFSRPCVNYASTSDTKECPPLDLAIHAQVILWLDAIQSRIEFRSLTPAQQCQNKMDMHAIII